MELKEALSEQYHGGLAMLAECVEKCPDDLWAAGVHPRPFWRIAWHTLYFTHNYLVRTADDFNDSLPTWPEFVRTALGLKEGQKAIDVEPYELPESAVLLKQSEMLEYIAYIRGIVDSTIDRLDLERDDTGFPWYPNMSKLSHVLMNLRHIQGHVGQLSELLMARGIDTDWISKSRTGVKGES
jgi:hypothetical protein